MNFLKRLETATPNKGQIGLFWLGQAGFLIKNSAGELLALDVYLSDLSEKQDGNKRLMMSVLEPEELKPDILLASHFHTDHLDLESLPVILKNPVKMFCCRQSLELCEKAGLPMDKIRAVKPGDVVTEKGFVIEAVFADHGDSAVDALGFLVKTEGITLYFAGDTSFQPDRMAHAIGQDVDILVVPINGEYGNLNERDAAMMAAAVKARLTIPSHFWLFARHRGNPYDFELEMKAHVPECRYYTMAQGELLYYPE